VAAAGDMSPRDVDVAALRGTLRENGAILEPVPHPL
jgi:hypothetical protein